MDFKITTITRTINAPREKVFQANLDPQDIIHWCFASEGWFSRFAEVDAKVGGKLRVDFSSADGKNDFIFDAVFDEITAPSKIRYHIADGRPVTLTFDEENGQTKVTLELGLENENSEEMQRQGWGTILDNLGKYMALKSNPNYRVIRKAIDIKAPASKVWKTLLEDETYREWTSVFTEGISEGSYYEISEWKVGNTIKFKSAPSGDGIVSKVAVLREPIQVSFEHLGEIHQGVEDMNSKAWSGSHEIYTLSEKDGMTHLDIFLDMVVTPESEAMADEMAKMWDKALPKVKEIAER